MRERLSVPIGEPATLVELLRTRAFRQPGDDAYTFLVDGEMEEVHLSYAELDRQARSIAALLQELEAAGERALLLYPPGLEFISAFFGCLYAGVIAVPAYPPNLSHLDRTLPRLRAIMQDARPSVVLTTTALLSRSDVLRAQAPEFQHMHWLATDDAGVDAADQWREPALNRETLAFLQYTSGSTAAPKGVMVSHGNLLSNERMVQQAFGHTEQSTFAGWLPLYHDMGLIGNVLQPLYIGAACILMAPMAFLQRPVRWLQAISRYRARTSGGPNFAYDLCVRKITDEQRAALDLSSWRVAFNGAEPVRASTLEQFTATFAPCGFRPETFYPCYGLAEATLFVSGGTPAALPIFQTVQGTALEHNQVLTASADHEATRRLVGCGQTWQEQQIRIVDPETQTECPGGRVGEIWVSGPNVAQGYWQHADATERTFQARLAGTQDGPFLRTGDLGFMQDGELFVTGRLKDMIIISGRNHYPQDIEQTVEHSHPAIRLGCCAAFSIDVDGEERLVVAAEVDRHHRPPSRNASLETGNLPEGMAPADCESMVKAIRRAVVEQHDLRVHEVVLLKVGGVPKTSSGKIQRHACRNGLLAGSLDLWAGRGERRRRSEAASHAVPEATRISATGTAQP